MFFNGLSWAHNISNDLSVLFCLGRAGTWMDGRVGGRAEGHLASSISLAPPHILNHVSNSVVIGCILLGTWFWESTWPVMPNGVLQRSSRPLCFKSYVCYLQDWSEQISFVRFRNRGVRWWMPRSLRWILFAGFLQGGCHNLKAQRGQQIFAVIHIFLDVLLFL